MFSIRATEMIFVLSFVALSAASCGTAEQGVAAEGETVGVDCQQVAESADEEVDSYPVDFFLVSTDAFVAVDQLPSLDDVVGEAPFGHSVVSVEGYRLIDAGTVRTVDDVALSDIDGPLQLVVENQLLTTFDGIDQQDIEQLALVVAEPVPGLFDAPVAIAGFAESGDDVELLVPCGPAWLQSDLDELLSSHGDAIGDQSKIDFLALELRHNLAADEDLGAAEANETPVPGVLDPGGEWFSLILNLETDRALGTTVVCFSQTASADTIDLCANDDASGGNRLGVRVQADPTEPIRIEVRESRSESGRGFGEEIGFIEAPVDELMLSAEEVAARESTLNEQGFPQGRSTLVIADDEIRLRVDE